MLIIFEIVVLKSFIGVVLKKCRTMLSWRLESKVWNESENQNLKTRNLLVLRTSRQTILCMPAIHFFFFFLVTPECSEVVGTHIQSESTLTEETPELYKSSDLLSNNE